MFRSPHPTGFCGSVQAGVTRVPWQPRCSIPTSVKGEEGDFPRAALKLRCVCAGVCVEVRELRIRRKKKADTDFWPVHSWKREWMKDHLPPPPLLSSNRGQSWPNFWFPWKPCSEHVYCNSLSANCVTKEKPVNKEIFIVQRDLSDVCICKFTCMCMCLHVSVHSF